MVVNCERPRTAALLLLYCTKGYERADKVKVMIKVTTYRVNFLYTPVRYSFFFFFGGARRIKRINTRWNAFCEIYANSRGFSDSCFSQKFCGRLVGCILLGFNRQKPITCRKPLKTVLVFVYTCNLRFCYDLSILLHRRVGFSVDHEFLLHK